MDQNKSPEPAPELGSMVQNHQAQASTSSTWKCCMPTYLDGFLIRGYPWLMIDAP